MPIVIVTEDITASVTMPAQNLLYYILLSLIGICYWLLEILWQLRPKL